MSSREVARPAERDLRALLGPEGVLPGTTAQYLTDATESRAVRGRADAIALPSDARQVASVVRWCYDHDVPVIPRGGGTGLAGGAVPTDGGVVLGLERMRAVRSLEGELWRAQVEAGITTADVARLARETGLLYPPDPGAAEQSQIGGNIATNAGGPHTFKYGVTSAWVTGLEFVLAPGEVVSIGGPVRKDVAGYDLKSLLIGSEGTLAVVTAAWLRLTPSPESQLPVVAFYASAAAGCEALCAVLASGLVPAALEYLDEGAVAAAARLVSRYGAASRCVHADRGGRRVGGRGAAAAHRVARGAQRAGPVAPRPDGAARDQRVVAMAGGRVDRRHRPFAAASSPKTSSSRSSAWARRSPRPARSARATGCRPAAGVTPVTATCTRRS